ncbi:MAG: hypothetical protein P4L90_06865 [Rhodopila sp.]|nr:hypothetical protein [Rhodopila sp.]
MVEQHHRAGPVTPTLAQQLLAADNISPLALLDHLANRVFDTCTAIVDACRDAWNKLTAAPETIRRYWRHTVLGLLLGATA